MILQYTLAILLLALPQLIFFRKITEMKAAEKKKSKAPFTEKMLRPAGESLRLKIDEIREAILEAVAKIFLWISAPAIVLFFPRQPNAAAIWLIWVIATVFCYRLAMQKWSMLTALRTKFRNYTLGFDGERYVAAELDLLRSDGFQVFHDFIVDRIPGGEATNFNIDHIVAGNGVIFAIETKARRKPEGIHTAPPEDQKETKARATVTFDGNVLRFLDKPPESAPVEQALRNAEELTLFLKGSSSRQIPVIPVIVIPGWWVEHGGKRPSDFPVAVFSGRKVAKWLRPFPVPQPLTDDEMRVATARIESHCRNIDLE